jgi:alginate O-acetyltransferase complex protein AlgI
LRDYLYIPLGGNRSGTWKTYRNLLITMLLGGLWHGASWTFVAWGAYHGLLLAAYRAWGASWDRLSLSARKLGTFILVVVGWVFFRSTGFAMALQIIERMFVPAGGALVAQASLAVPALAVGAWLAMVGPNAFELSHDYRWGGRIAIVSGIAASLAVIAGLRTSPFLYFQF